MFRQQSRCRRRNGHCSVLAGYGARPQLHRSGEDGVHPEHFQADGSSRDIDDGIHRAHLMEMYFFRSSAVYAGLRLRQQGENRKGRPLYGIGKGACLNKLSYIRHSPVMVRMAAAGVPFFLRQYVNPCSPDAVLLRLFRKRGAQQIDQLGVTVAPEGCRTAQAPPLSRSWLRMPHGQNTGAAGERPERSAPHS